MTEPENDLHATAAENRRALPSDSPGESDSICVGCGLCCDGTLHGRTDINQRDEGALAAIGIPVIDVGKIRAFRQPCPHFSSGRCSVYERRPHVCQKYRCALLRNVQRGEMTASDARSKIGIAKSLVESVQRIRRDAITPKERFELATDLKTKLLGSEGDDASELANMLLDISALNRFLKRWFYKEESTEQNTPEGP